MKEASISFYDLGGRIMKTTATISIELEQEDFENMLITMKHWDFKDPNVLFRRFVRHMRRRADLLSGTKEMEHMIVEVE